MSERVSRRGCEREHKCEWSTGECFEPRDCIRVSGFFQFVPRACFFIVSWLVGDWLAVWLVGSLVAEPAQTLNPNLNQPPAWAPGNSQLFPNQSQ